MTIEEITALFSKEFNITLSAKEAQQFAEFEPRIFLGSCRSTAKWIAKKGAMVPPIVPSRASIIASALRTCQYRVDNPINKPAHPFRSFADRVQDLREAFQAQCTSDNTWTITDEEGTAALKQYSDAQLKKAFEDLGRYDEQHQAEALDRLEWLLSVQGDFNPTSSLAVVR
jgi:hypothetical protein